MPRPIRRHGPILAAFAGLAALAGCGGDGGLEAPGVRLDVLGPSEEPEAPPASTLAESDIVRRPVASVARLELGVTRRGRLLTAYGAAPATGWFQPTLAPRNGGAPGADGFVEFDFVAAPPELNGGVPGGVGTPAQRAVRADARLPDDAAARGLVGFRVFAAEGPPAALRLAPAAPAEG